MTFDISNFNPNDYEPEKGRPDPIPEGWYRAMIIESEMRQSKAGDPMIWLNWKVTEGDHEGNDVWQYILVAHPDEETREIAGKRLSSIYEAMECKEAIEDLSELHNKEAEVRVKTEESETYGASSKIARVRKPKVPF